MTRRRDTAKGIFHVTCHSVWDLDLYRDDIDRTNYCALLAQTTAQLGWECVGVCLMRTHVHLILGVEDGVLAEGMQKLGFRYAVGFNARHRRRGRIFGAPYGLRRVGDDADLLGVYRYVMLNPVEADLVERPEEWLWSSYASTVRLRDTFSFVDAGRVLGCLGGSSEIAAARLRAFVEGDLPVTVRRHAEAPAGRRRANEHGRLG
jgi:putative transposase